MFMPYWLAVAALAALPLAAVAQESRQQPRPDDAGATVAAPAYVSAFDNYRPLGELPDPPDSRWRAANREVGQLGGHGGHIRSRAVAPSASDSKPAAAPAAPQAPAGHGAHHHGGSHD